MVDDGTYDRLMSSYGATQSILGRLRYSCIIIQNNSLPYVNITPVFGLDFCRGQALCITK